MKLNPIQKNKRMILVMAGVLLFILLVVILLIILLSHPKEIDTTNAIHGVIVTENAILQIKKNQTIPLRKGEHILLLQEDMVTQTYQAMYGSKIGTISKKDVKYFQFNSKENYSLLCDISQFNAKDLFTDSGDLELFLLEHPINYVYMRLGGRGWGQKGVLYYDSEVTNYITACEYLGIPYGFYFLDEALNEEEIEEEVNFVKAFLI